MARYRSRRARRKRRQMTGPEALSFNLKRLRRLRGGISQQTLAERAEISLKQLSNIERKKVWVSAAMLTKLAKALGVSETALFFDPETEWTLDDLAALVARMARRRGK